MNENIINEIEQLLNRIYMIIKKGDWEEGRNLLNTIDWTRYNEANTTFDKISNSCNLIGRTSAYYLNNTEIYNNLVIRAMSINNELKSKYKGLPSVNFNIKIYYRNDIFRRNEILFKTNNGSDFSVEDFIKVCEYVIKIIEIEYSLDLKEYTEALKGFKSLYLVLNNKKEEKPYNEQLHYMNEILLEIYKKIENDSKKENSKREIALLIDSAIDFWVNG